MREQTRTGGTAGNRPFRCAGLNDAVTGGTREFRTNMADDPEAGRYVLKHFRNILTEWLQGTATVRAGTFRRKMLNGIPWQMLRQRFAFGCGGGFRCWSRSGFCGLVLLGGFVARLFAISCPLKLSGHQQASA